MRLWRERGLFSSNKITDITSRVPLKARFESLLSRDLAHSSFKFYFSQFGFHVARIPSRDLSKSWRALEERLLAADRAIKLQSSLRE